MPAVAATTDGTPNGPPRLVLPEPRVDLGILIRGEVRHARFPVRNDGGQPLAIQDARPGCKCTVTEYDDEVLPGRVGYVNATIDSHSLWGKVSRFVTLYTNDPEQPRRRLQIDAIVIGSVELVPTDRMQLTNRASELGRSLLLVRQEPTEAGTLDLTIAESPPWLTVTATRLEDRRPAGDGIPVGRPGDYVVEARLSGQPPSGRSETEFTFLTGLEREPRVHIPVSVNFRPAIELSVDRLELARGESGLVLVGVRRGFDPKTLAVRAEPAALETRLEPSGERHYKLHVRWGGSPGAGTVTLGIGGETYRIPIVGR